MPPRARYRQGHVAIVGRPNVGKSTLLNRLVERKMSITADCPQTTRAAIYGTRDEPDCRMIFIDTPGLQRRYRKFIDRKMSRMVDVAINDADVIVLVITANEWHAENDAVIERFAADIPAIALINKTDRVKDKKTLLPLAAQLAQRERFCEIIPVSATRGVNIDTLISAIKKYLPTASRPTAQAAPPTDIRFQLSELLREQLVRHLGDELPHVIGVAVEDIAYKKKVAVIMAAIIIEAPSQKAIIIGRGGNMLRKATSGARRGMEALLGRRIYLTTQVRVMRDWRKKNELLKKFHVGTVQ